MEIELPNQGCNIFYGTYIDNYYNSRRTRYYLNDGHLVQSTITTSSSTPTGATCISTGDLYYRPELIVYFQLASFAIVGIVFYIIFNLLVKKLWGGK